MVRIVAASAHVGALTHATVTADNREVLYSPLLLPAHTAIPPVRRRRRVRGCFACDLLCDQPNHGGSRAPRDFWHKLRMHRSAACVCRAAQVRTVPMLRELAALNKERPCCCSHAACRADFCPGRRAWARCARGLGPLCPQGVEALTNLVSCVQGALEHAAAVLRAAEAMEDRSHFRAGACFFFSVTVTEISEMHGLP
jgi:hypothetical protein